jgi:hypothetical protein
VRLTHKPETTEGELIMLIELAVMSTLDDLQRRLNCTRQEARFYALGRAEATAASHTVIDMLRQMIAEAKEN